jgi:hypothetical protein
MGFLAVGIREMPFGELELRFNGTKRALRSFVVNVVN